MSRTKKIKSSRIDKNKLWKEFDKSQFNDSKIEVLYDNTKNKNNQLEKCSECDSALFIGDNGYYCCSNINCGIMYKNRVDLGAEWRYYGAEDSQSNDPTRCGMPINPLLVESSFGCKIMCNMSSTYEMRKIKRYTEWQSMPYREKAKYDDFQIITHMATN